MAHFRDSASDALDAVVTEFGVHAYALVDGGLFENLPVALKELRLRARPLFLEAADPALQIAGPWIVPLAQSTRAYGAVLDLIGEKPSRMFWRCAEGEVALFRHLRKLNMVQIPRWAARGADEPYTEGDRTIDIYVTFRHWDPRVLTDLLPVLDAQQFARIIGKAMEIVFVDPDRGLKRVIKDEAWPIAPVGPLRIDTDQMFALTRRRIAVSQYRIARYLRVAASSETSGFNDADLIEKVRTSQSWARPLGLHSENSLANWAYAAAKSQWDEEKYLEYSKVIRSSPHNPEDAVLALAQSISENRQIRT